MSVFRLSATLQHPIVPALLQMALNFTVQRFPAYTATLEKRRLLALSRRHHAPLQRRARAHHSLPADQDLPVAARNPSACSIMKNRISVEFFHVLCDALSVACAFTALVSEYLRLCGEQIAPDPRIPDILEPPPDAELEKCVPPHPRKTLRSSRRRKASAAIWRRAHAHKALSDPPHLQMDAAALKAVAERAGVSVTAYMLALSSSPAKPP